MSNSTRLSLPLLDAAQAQKHVTHNEALIALDALVHLSVEARDLVAPPAAPLEGQRFLVGDAPIGAFAGKSWQVACFDSGGWSFLQPRAGWRLFVAEETLLLAFDGAAWVDAGLSLRRLANLERLGVGTAADAENPISVKANAALFSARAAAEGGSGDLRMTLNKSAAANTVSQLYQSNWSGRAETGLSGDDDFHLKVSPDGVAWKDALVVDRATGAISFPSGGPAKIIPFASTATYTPSAGVRLIEVILFGAGGGGGSGARTAAGVAASGGGGGGGGGMLRAIFMPAQVGASQTVTIGAGGAGGVAQTTNSMSGNSGSSGGYTAFGTLARVSGGGAGSGGSTSGSGGGAGGAPTGSGSAYPGSGGAGGSNWTGVGSGGSAGNAATVITTFASGGAGSGGGGAPASGGAGGAGGHQFSGAGTGGGAGGGLTSANAVSAGGVGGASFVAAWNDTAGGASGAAGANGGAGPAPIAARPITHGAAGGGGGGSSVTVAGSGGAGATPCGGGGGGGAHQNGGSGGAGGAGGAGYAVVIEHF